jgi:carbon storage regulator
VPVLIVTRKTGERVMIGDEVAVVVLDVEGSTVKLGVEAPRSVTVHRGEVWEQIQAANVEAAASEHPLPEPGDTSAD